MATQSPQEVPAITEDMITDVLESTRREGRKVTSIVMGVYQFRAFTEALKSRMLYTGRPDMDALVQRVESDPKPVCDTGMSCQAIDARIAIVRDMTLPPNVVRFYSDHVLAQELVL
jgi:hypothetical protein